MSKFISIHLHLNKASSPESLKGWVNYREKQTSRTIKEIRMDNAGEYTLKKFEEWCETKGIDHQTSAPHKQNQNRITENAVHHITPLFSKKKTIKKRMFSGHHLISVISMTS